MSRYEYYLSRFPDTLSWVNRLDLHSLKAALLEDDDLPRVYLGSGGSLSVAYLAAQLSVEHGIVATAMTPYQFIFSPWSNIAVKVVLFSAGGRNVDVINAAKTIQENAKQKSVAVLLQEGSTLEQMMLSMPDANVFVYQRPCRDGFLATNSVVAFYSMLFRVFHEHTFDIDFSKYDSNSRHLVKSFIENCYNLQTNDWNDHDAALYNARELDRFYLLYPPELLPVAVDMESRFSEGSVGCLQMSDYRNFAHGRFNWFNLRKGQTGIIALISADQEKIATDILAELPKDIAVLRIISEEKGDEAFMDFMLKGQYLCNAFAMRWGLDLAKPNVPQFGKKIHKMDFMESTE